MQTFILDFNFNQIMDGFTNPLVIGGVMLLTGILAAAWLFERIVDPIPLVGDIMKWLIHFGTYFGFIVGILDMLVGYVVYVKYVAVATTATGAIIITGLFILAGFALVMRILAKFPIALVFALAIAAFGVFTMYGFLQPIVDNWSSPPIPGADYAYDALVFLTSLKGMLIVGAIIFVFIYIISGLILKFIELIGKFFSWTPVSIIIGLVCVAAGIIVLIMPEALNLPFPDNWEEYIPSVNFTLP
ncbi:MAG: hypothetical protein RTU30_11740 [Candidatus Thorarchaeota archaeon]